MRKFVPSSLDLMVLIAEVIRLRFDAFVTTQFFRVPALFFRRMHGVSNADQREADGK